MNILIADDTRTNRLILGSMLREDRHTVILAENGREAVALFEAEQPDLVIMDLVMPELDGYEAARMIKSLACHRFVPIMFLTAVSDEEGLAKCIACGGDDFLTKPYNQTILRAKIAAWKRMLDLHRTVTAQNEKLEEHHARLRQEEDVANQIRSNVLNAGCLNHIGIRYRLIPAAILGGDLILAARRPTGALHIMVGDFTGHGLSSSIGALPVADLFYQMTEQGCLLRDIVIAVNEKLRRTLPIGLFCAACFIDLAPLTRTAFVWNGGLPPVLVFNPDAGCRAHIPSRHPPLGLLSDEEFRCSFEEIALTSDDRILVYSDGLIEASNPAGELFGEERLMRCLAKRSSSDQVFDDILDALGAFTSGAILQDDLTLVDIPVDRVAAQLDHANIHETSQGEWPLEWDIQIRLGPDAIRTHDPVPDLLQLVSQIPGLYRQKERLFTVLSEILTNAIDHGLLGLDSSFKSSIEGFDRYYMERGQRLAELREGSITVHLRHIPENGGGTLTIRVEDSGPGFDQSTPAQDFSGNVTISGRGIALIRSLCQRVTFHGKGNCIEAVFAW